VSSPASFSLDEMLSCAERPEGGGEARSTGGRGLCIRS
jgi:hypothetical protein